MSLAVLNMGHCHSMSAQVDVPREYEVFAVTFPKSQRPKRNDQGQRRQSIWHLFIYFFRRRLALMLLWTAQLLRAMAVRLCSKVVDTANSTSGGHASSQSTLPTSDQHVNNEQLQRFCTITGTAPLVWTGMRVQRRSFLWLDSMSQRHLHYTNFDEKTQDGWMTVSNSKQQDDMRFPERTYRVV